MHPRYLDARGLVALWREALLAQKVLKVYKEGKRRGYRFNRCKICAASPAE